MRNSFLLAAVLVLFTIPTSAATPTASGEATPPTLRVDIQHGGDAKSEHYALERVVVEPLPWPGNPAQPLDSSNRGSQKFEVVDADSGRVLYSRGYSTIFGEWRSTDEAQATQRSFQESLRFPMPAKSVQLKLYARDAANAFVPVWSLRVDPQALDVERHQVEGVSRPPPGKVIAIRDNGDPSRKLDL